MFFGVWFTAVYMTGKILPSRNLHSQSCGQAKQNKKISGSIKVKIKPESGDCVPGDPQALLVLTAFLK